MGIQARVLAAKRKQLWGGFLPEPGWWMVGPLAAMFIWGGVAGMWATRWSLSRVLVSNGVEPAYLLQSQGGSDPVRIIRCHGGCAIQRTGETVDVEHIPSPDDCMAPLPDNPFFKKM